jgi:hypothetical protein
MNKGIPRAGGRPPSDEKPRRETRIAGPAEAGPAVLTYPAVVANTSVRFAGLPLFTATKTGANAFPMFVRPSYSPRKYPNGPRAAGACSMSNDVVVSRFSLPIQLAGSVQAAWQWTIQ